METTTTLTNRPAVGRAGDMATAGELALDQAAEYILSLDDAAIITAGGWLLLRLVCRRLYWRSTAAMRGFIRHVRGMLRQRLGDYQLGASIARGDVIMGESIDACAHGELSSVPGLSLAHLSYGDIRRRVVMVNSNIPEDVTKQRWMVPWSWPAAGIGTFVQPWADSAQRDRVAYCALEPSGDIITLARSMRFRWLYSGAGDVDRDSDRGAMRCAGAAMIRYVAQPVHRSSRGERVLMAAVDYILTLEGGSIGGGDGDCDGAAAAEIINVLTWLQLRLVSRRLRSLFMRRVMGTSGVFAAYLYRCIAGTYGVDTMRTIFMNKHIITGYFLDRCIQGTGSTSLLLTVLVTKPGDTERCYTPPGLDAKNAIVTVQSMPGRPRFNVYTAITVAPAAVAQTLGATWMWDNGKLVLIDWMRHAVGDR